MLRLNNSNNFFHVTWDIRGADAGMGFGDQERRTIWRLLLHLNVVHTFEGRLSGVDFEDNSIAEADRFSDDTAGRGQSQTTIFGDG